MFDTPPKIVLWATVIVLLAGCARASSSASTETVPLYLEEVVPPCVPTESEPDPCPPDLPAIVELNLGGPHVDIIMREVPSFTERFLYDSDGGVTQVHIVVRGTVKTNTTRCDIYRAKVPDYMVKEYKQIRIVDQYIVDSYDYSCFADVSIKEYIVGEGPPTLTVLLNRVVIHESDLDSEGNASDYFLKYFGNPEATATVYEGREIVFLLGAAPSIEVEAWTGLGGGKIWFLQQTEDGIRAIADSYPYAILEEHRQKLDLPLDKMIEDIKQAAKNRAVITDGRIGIDPDLPMYITDAYKLRDYYIAVGAVYDDTDKATRLPPPVPGEGDPSASAIPTNEGSPSMYLEESKPPCVFSHEEVDPCPVDVPPEVETLSVHSSYPAWPSGDNIRTFEQIFLRDYSIVSPHLVVRGIAKPNSSRCDLYPIQKANFLMEILERDYSGTYDYLNTHYHYHCFVDIEVNEYIVGKGPSVLTVSMLREVLSRIDPATWDVEQATQLQNPRLRTATAYEGREMILFLTTPSTIAVESWRAKGLFTVWFIQNTENGIRAVSQDIRYALTDGQRNKLNRPLDDIVKEIKEANEYRVEITNGRIGRDASLPLLVTDANHLRDYYIELGAVYNTGEDDTVLPPPVPEECEPAAPAIPTNEGTAETTEPAPVETMAATEATVTEPVTGTTIWWISTKNACG